MEVVTKNMSLKTQGKGVFLGLVVSLAGVQLHPDWLIKKNTDYLD